MSRTDPDSDAPSRPVTKLLAVVGVVYGDIGTSPLYTLRECFTHPGGPALGERAILGVLSMIFWSLTLIITVKYVGFVMRADNRGEGGVLALTALALRAASGAARRRVLILVGIVGASLFLGDGVITPAISVLSAVEGLKVATPIFSPVVLPLTLAVLAALFWMQSRGTAKVGRLFGPIISLWFVVIGLLGLAQLVHNPGVLEAVLPHHAVDLFFLSPWAAFVVMGSVVLSITGGEALYADMGHFGRKPIRIMWLGFVWPALLLNYFGQGALLLERPETIENPFYLLAPEWLLLPLVVLATAATVIASQAVISGAFSVVQQAVQLGYLPRFELRHTSAEEKGQIYIPRVNWLLFVAVAALVVGFQNSSNLAGAYGIAVTGTMMVTAFLAFLVAWRLWHWSLWLAAPLFGLFFLVELVFFGANTLKIVHGGWFPIVLAVALTTIMVVWWRGRAVLYRRRYRDAIPIDAFIAGRMYKRATRVPGTAVFATGNIEVVPFALLHNLKHNKVLHERVVLMKVETADEPRVAAADRLAIRELDDGFLTLRIRYGFQEQPDIPRALADCGATGLRFDMAATSFFLSREYFVPSSHPALPPWQEFLFIAMSNNALNATEFFRIPPNRTIEVGSHMEI
jgi:KUP system potassium uptake protein